MASNSNPSTRTDCKHRRYYEGNKEELREKSRLRMAKLRAERRMLASTQTGLVLPQAGLNGNQSQDETGLGSDSQSDDAEEGSWDSPRPFNRSITNPDLSGSGAESIDDEVPERIRLTPFEEIDHFRAASDAVNAWLAEWGGLEVWPRRLDSGYEAAKKTGHVDQWIQMALDHADRGRLLHNLLSQMETVLPPELWKIRELWRQQTVLLGLVIKGLALIEMRVDIVQRGPFNLVQ
ncbi:hypothetical protein BDN72DRAFT_906242 [Pluteus cervinus]|uniref:Uncharacterized protein n=1 Tax=Pluteus cervinus TaxID=181527 RepID=A0ACD2ZZX8_9AGAR|nr:hypothetical protein BDN72DRAFT_906242 [Pluteus cervinus]